MTISRRNIAKSVPLFIAMGALAACGAPGATTSVPTLTQVQAWVAIINTELPAFITESETTGILAGDVDTKVKTALATFQQLATQFLAPTFNAANATAIVAEIGTALTIIVNAIPVAVPYVGFIQLAVLVITSFLALKPIIVPPLPTSMALASMHTQNLHFKK